MEFKGIKEYEGLYSVSRYGLVKSLERITVVGGGIREPYKRKKSELMLKRGLSVTGYYRVYLSKDGEVTPYFVHRLVAEAFIPNPENKPCVNHKNGVKTDNRKCNLEWCTHLENVRHAISTGLFKVKGSNNSNAKISEREVLGVCRLLEGGLSDYRDISDRTGVPINLIRDINLGINWNYLTGRKESRTKFGRRTGKDHSRARSVINCRGEVFDTTHQAADAFDLKGKSKISAACRGQQKSAGKYPDGSPVIWKYLDNKIEEAE